MDMDTTSISMKSCASLPVLSMSKDLSDPLMKLSRSQKRRTVHAEILSMKSPLRDLAPIAQPGLSQRVMRRGSLMSVADDPAMDVTLSLESIRSEDVVEVSLVTRTLILATIAACMPAMQYGFNLASMNTAAPAMRADLGIQKASADGTVMPGNNFIWSLCVSALPMAGMIGCKVGAALADRLGRRKGLMILSAFFVLGASLQASSKFFVQDGQMGWSAGVILFIMGRLICGLAGGATTVMVPMYIGEISPPHLRGALGAVFQTSQVLFMLITQVMGLPSFMGTAELWQLYIVILEIAPFVLLGVLLPFLVESPYWASEHHPNGANVVRSTLMSLRGYHSDDEALTLEADLMPRPGERGIGSKAVGFRQAWANPAARQGLIIALIVGASQQLSGINNVFNFSTQVMEDNHISEDTITIIAIAMNVGNVINSVLASTLMDRAGRRPLLLGSAFGMAISGLVLSCALSIQLPILIIVSTVGFVMSFGIGMGPLPWLLPCELFSPEYSSFGVSTAATANWSANFIVTMTFETIAEVLGGLCFLPNVVLLVIFCYWAWRVVPETRGKTIDQIMHALCGESIVKTMHESTISPLHGA